MPIYILNSTIQSNTCTVRAYIRINASHCRIITNFAKKKGNVKYIFIYKIPCTVRHNIRPRGIRSYSTPYCILLFPVYDVPERCFSSNLLLVALRRRRCAGKTTIQMPAYWLPFCLVGSSTSYSVLWHGKNQTLAISNLRNAAASIYFVRYCCLSLHFASKETSN